MTTSNILFHWIPHFFHDQLFVTPESPRNNCEGKTIIVTGSNVGLGKEAARHFVRMGAARVILACRTVSKGEAAAREIEESTKRKGVVEVWQLDMSSYANVKAFAERAKSLQRLDSALLNAGISTMKFQMAEDNESTVTVNVVSTFLLALLLMPTMQSSAKQYGQTPTLTIVSSEVHGLTDLPESKSASIFNTLNDERTAKMMSRYNTSKLLEVLACRQIVKDHPVKRTQVAINFVNPGLCHSELMREIDNPLASLFKKLLARTTEVGSRTLVHAALGGPETHGKYLSNCKITQCSPFVEGKKGPELERRVWAELSEKLNHIQSGVTDLLDA